MEWLAGLAWPRLRDGLHLVFVGSLFALIAWQAANDILTPPPPSAIVIQAGALTVAVVAALAYGHRLAVRWWLTALAPAPLVVLLLFLVFSPLRPIVFGGGGPTPERVSSTGAPVVFIVFDELPVVSLMGPDGEIDADRYPHFARLAGMATWYRDAAGSADYTALAVPSILTGTRGNPDQVQVVADHPRSIFTLLGGSYHLDVSEWATHLCQTACPEQVKAPLSIRLRRLDGASIDSIPALPSWARERIARRLSHLQPIRRSSRCTAAASGGWSAALRTSDSVAFSEYSAGAPRQPCTSSTLGYRTALLTDSRMATDTSRP